MRKKIVAGNWKMNNDLDQTIKLINELKSLITDSEIEIIIAPSFPFLKIAVDLTKDSKIEIVSQNVNDNSNGAFR